MASPVSPDGRAAGGGKGLCDNTTGKPVPLHRRHVTLEVARFMPPVEGTRAASDRARWHYGDGGNSNAASSVSTLLLGHLAVPNPSNGASHFTKCTRHSTLSTKKCRLA